MTGSADGSAALWDTSFVEKKLNMQPDEEILPLQSQMLPLKNMDISEETLITKIEEPQVDGKKTES